MIKEKVKTGRFNFALFVEIMQSDGYVTELDCPDEIGMDSCTMESTSSLQAEFDELFEFFYKGYSNEVKLSCIATNQGFKYPSGAYSYALYNENIISQIKVEQVLIKENAASEE